MRMSAVQEGALQQIFLVKGGNIQGNDSYVLISIQRGGSCVLIRGFLEEIGHMLILSKRKAKDEKEAKK